MIRCQVKLLRPAMPANASWAFLVLPANASARLPRRGQTTVQGALNGAPFQATLEPDGEGSHWLKVSSKLRKSAGVNAGDRVDLEFAPVGREPQPRVPADLRTALTSAPAAQATWAAITAVARRDWILWITSAKRPETRARRIANACDNVASGKRRVCCFDRSGQFSKSLGAPEAA